MNGYIQININGQPTGIKFGEYAIKKFRIAAEKNHDVFYEKVKNQKTGKEEDSLTFLGIAKIFHCGYLNNCAIKEAEPELTLEVFNDFVEQVFFGTDEKSKEEMAKGLNVFSESQYVKLLVNAVNELEEEETKKKGSKNTSKKSKANS